MFIIWLLSIYALIVASSPLPQSNPPQAKKPSPYNAETLANQISLVSTSEPAAESSDDQEWDEMDVGGDGEIKVYTRQEEGVFEMSNDFSNFSSDADHGDSTGEEDTPVDDDE